MWVSAFCSSKMAVRRVRLADGFLKRLWGLLFTDALPEGEGLLLRPCSSVHTIGMRYPIDVVYLGAGGAVLRVDAAMVPGRLGPLVRGARDVLELPAGAALRCGLMPGCTVTFRQSD